MSLKQTGNYCEFLFVPKRILASESEELYFAIWILRRKDNWRFTEVFDEMSCWSLSFPFNLFPDELKASRSSNLIRAAEEWNQGLNFYSSISMLFQDFLRERFMLASCLFRLEATDDFWSRNIFAILAISAVLERGKSKTANSDVNFSLIFWGKSFLFWWTFWTFEKAFFL